MRKKLKLSVEELAVVTFETRRAGEDHGAVQANAISGNHLTCKTCLTNITCCTPLI
jgi:hypothetical protein